MWNKRSKCSQDLTKVRCQKWRRASVVLLMLIVPGACWAQSGGTPSAEDLARENEQFNTAMTAAIRTSRDQVIAPLVNLRNLLAEAQRRPNYAPDGVQAAGRAALTAMQAFQTALTTVANQINDREALRAGSITSNGALFYAVALSYYNLQGTLRLALETFGGNSGVTAAQIAALDLSCLAAWQTRSRGISGSMPPAPALRSLTCVSPSRTPPKVGA